MTERETGPNIEHEPSDHSIGKAATRLIVSRDTSPRLRSAAEAEKKQIATTLNRIDRRLLILNTERDALRAERAYLKQREKLLQQLIDPAATDQDIDRSSPMVLSGARIRIEAVGVLVQERKLGQPVHYRDWFQLMQKVGFIVLGKRPEATFLSAVGRSPVVRRGDESGTYYVDPTLADDLSDKLSDHQTQLEDLELAIARESHPRSFLRAQRAELEANCRHLETQLEEARQALGIE